MFWEAIKKVSDADLKLVDEGYYVVLAHGDVAGHPSGNANIDAAYDLLTTKYGFSKKCSMASMSRGTLSLFRWASANPEKVDSIYVDNGVCNVLSWPAGKLVPGNNSIASGAPASWADFKKKFGYKTDEEALTTKESPIDQLEPLAKAGVPILMVCGSKDKAVPYEENDAILEKRYKALGGSIKVIVEDKGHSHGMKDPTPVLEFIRKHTSAPTKQTSAAVNLQTWIVDIHTDWLKAAADHANIEFKNGLATPTAKTATFRSVLKTFDKRRNAKSLTIDQSAIWHNWVPIPHIGPSNLGDAPVMLAVGPGNYWMFGQYGSSQKRKGYQSKATKLEGYDVALKTTPFPNQYDAPGGLKKGLGGYHAWQSKDMVNWVHHGPVTEAFSSWVTTAEYTDGKLYIYYDYPNDQDPHLYIDDDLTDGLPGKNMGMAFKDPSHGSDCAFIRDLQGRFHVIYEDWSPLDASTHSWDSPLAGHAVSATGIGDFKILPPAVDVRTKPTGKFGEYPHPHWHATDPKKYPGKPAPVDIPQHRIKKGDVRAFAKYEIHEPEQDAFGDWASICIGGQYYLFADYHPANSGIRVGWFTSSSLDKPFTFCGEIGRGHPDPDIMFAEGKFYLATQMSTDYVSPGPWVETVEARVGVDTDKDGKIDQWTDWTEVKESYDYIEGFSKQVAKTQAMMDLSKLPAGYGFRYELRLTDATENKSKPILDAVTLAFNRPTADAASKPYDGSWESLQKMPVPAWFDDGKIGIFIHWGPYSAIGYREGNRGYAEHVPKLFYEDPKHYYPYMKQRWGATPPAFGYKDVIPHFKAENWDPDEWAELFEEVGAKYVVLTAEHHDGWANWDSDLTPWNAVDMGPKRDLVGDLGAAVRKRGLKYAPSYHRERHTGFFAKEKYAVHSEPRPDIAEEIRRVPEAASLYGPFSYDKAFVDDYVARWKEIQDKYHPDFLWVDDFPIYTRDGNSVRSGTMKPEIKYFDDQIRRMITDFMNNATARGQEVYCNNKGGNRNWPDGVGCLEKDNLKLKVIGPKWQSCTTFGTSFGFLEGDQYKSVERVIHEMIEVVSRNGNFLINIGPKADGTLVPEQVKRLRAMGDWLKINGDAIYGTRYWKVSAQEDEHLAFTTKGKTLYAIKLAKPSAPFIVEAAAGWKAEDVKSVRLLGSDAEVGWSIKPDGLHIMPSSNLGESQFAWSFKIVTNADQHQPNAIIAEPKQMLNQTRQIDLDGAPK